MRYEFCTITSYLVVFVGKHAPFVPSLIIHLTTQTLGGGAAGVSGPPLPRASDDAKGQAVCAIFALTYHSLASYSFVFEMSSCMLNQST